MQGHAPRSGGRLCLVGLGLMGGSLALALQRAEWPERIVGVSRSAETVSAALAAGAIDEGATSLSDALSGATTVVLATPVRTLLKQLPMVARVAPAGCLVMDLGSTKSRVCAAMATLPPGLQPVGGHPMCGRENGGFAAADADLYRDRVFVLCPLERTAPQALGRARRLAEEAGARTLILDAEAHDRAAAAISHLPHALAVTLINTVVGSGNADAWKLASSGFRDTTRLAASGVEMMLDVMLTNASMIDDWLAAFSIQLDELRQALNAADEAALRTALTMAQSRRRDLRI